MKYHPSILSQNILLYFVALTLALTGNSAVAQGPVSIPHTVEIPFHSDINQQDYLLHIALPYDYETSTDTYPVVYLLDSNNDFPLVTAISRRLQWEDDLKEFILVGIGYKESHWLKRRADYTPSHNSSREESGGGIKFKNVIEQEIMPLIEKKFRTDAQSKTLLGHSLGGLFGAFLLVSEESQFSSYIISSPSMWWDNSFVLRGKENSRLQSNASVFLTVGADENPHMVEGWSALSSFIAKNMPMASKNATKLEGENHASAKFRAYADGLRWLFKKGAQTNAD